MCSTSRSKTFYLHENFYFLIFTIYFLSFSVSSRRRAQGDDKDSERSRRKQTTGAERKKWCEKNKNPNAYTRETCWVELLGPTHWSLIFNPCDATIKMRHCLPLPPSSHVCTLARASLTRSFILKRHTCCHKNKSLNLSADFFSLCRLAPYTPRKNK